MRRSLNIRDLKRLAFVILAPLIFTGAMMLVGVLVNFLTGRPLTHGNWAWAALITWSLVQLWAILLALGVIRMK